MMSSSRDSDYAGQKCDVKIERLFDRNNNLHVILKSQKGVHFFWTEYSAWT